jgi:hypothetical protein
VQPHIQNSEHSYSCNTAFTVLMEFSGYFWSLAHLSCTVYLPCTVWFISQTAHNLVQALGTSWYRVC